MGPTGQRCHVNMKRSSRVHHSHRWEVVRRTDLRLMILTECRQFFVYFQSDGFLLQSVSCRGGAEAED